MRIYEYIGMLADKILLFSAIAFSNYFWNINGGWPISVILIFAFALKIYSWLIEISKLKSLEKEENPNLEGKRRKQIRDGQR